MTAENSTLFTLPLELRELIYKEVLSQSFQGPQLLLICREIYDESRKFLFQRPLVFRDQSALYRWLREVPQDLLQYVGDIFLDIQDVDLTLLLASVTSSSTSQPDPSSSLHIWDIYEREIGKLSRALKSFENVKTFTLRAISGRQSHLYHDFLEKILSTLSSVYPALQDLTLQGNLHHQSLTFLRPFRYLKAFSFDGFSASKPDETAEILSSLQLTNVSLVSQHTMLTPARYQHSSFTTKAQSFDSQALRTMNHLAVFSVTERHSGVSSPSLFFNPDILGSLHSPTLTSLSVFLSHEPDARTLAALERCLEKSITIETLEFDWPDLLPEVLERYALLPDTLKCVWIRAIDMASAFDILWTIFESREAGDAQGLRRVVLVRAQWDTASRRMDETCDHTHRTTQQSRELMTELEQTSSDDSDEANVARAKGRLYALGVRVAWRTEVARWEQRHPHLSA